MLGPIAWRTPPEHYGPWELVTSLLTEGLVEQGVSVTLFATADARTTAELDWVCERPYAQNPEVDGRISEARHVAHALGRSGEFDLVHNQLDWLPLAFSSLCRAPMVTTVHGFSDRRLLPAYRAAESALVSISDSSRVPELDYAATVYHGIDLGEFPYSAGGGDDLVVLGRIHPDKGTAEAIRIARAAGRRLFICGIVQDADYFAEQVEPFLNDESVIHLGSVAPAQRAAVLGRAAALLHPIGFDEPFGLAVVESLACGTPVIAYRRGSMPELLSDGRTGFLVDDAAAATAAVTRLGELDRADCRDAAQRRFTVSRMVTDYLSVYEQLLRR